ncbi:MAG: hypothetical protein NTU98_09015 [Bacteroidetes bacterium]|nr:hypothetical protein [Bacteroidota bacterium]
MKSLFRLLLLLFFFIPAGTQLANAQRFDYTDKVFFADSVKKIRVWAYMEGDTLYRYDPGALFSLKETLEKKGYLVDVVVFEPRQNVSPQDWKHTVVSGLKNNEAFLELLTRIEYYSVTGPSSNAKAVTYPSGAPFVTQNKPGFSDSTQLSFSCKAVTKVYVNWKTQFRNKFVPVYSRTEKLTSGDIGLAVTYTAGGIPKSTHPAVQPASPASAKRESVGIEIVLFGGYTFSSEMDVAGGTGSNFPGVAKFNANAQYGLEIGLGISKNIDIILQYRRLGSIVDVNTSNEPETNSLTINQNFILAGMNYNFRVNKVVSPYAGFSIGGLNGVPHRDDLRDYWYFVSGVQGGIKFYLSKVIGLRLQADLLYQMHTAQAPFLYTNNPSDKSVEATSNMLQAGISAGLIIRLGRQVK